MKRNPVSISNCLDLNESTEEKGKSHSDILLFQDFLRFAFEEKGIQPFKFTELANWLLDNNANLQTEFAGSHVSKSYRLHSKSSFIKKRLNEMIEDDRIEIIGNIKSEKNNAEIPLYKFNMSGFRIAEDFYKRNYPDKYNVTKEKHREALYIYAKEFAEYAKSTEDKFYLLILQKLYSTGNYEQFASFSNSLIEGGYRYHIFTLFCPWLDEGGAEGFKQNLMPEDYDIFSKFDFTSLVLEIFNILDDNIKKLLLYQFKLGIEDYYYFRFSTKEFEMLRFQNRVNYKKITIQTICSLCDTYFTQIVEIEDFLKNNIGKLDKSYLFACPKCDIATDRKNCKVVEAK